jgi:hypothetical protein
MSYNHFQSLMIFNDSINNFRELLAEYYKVALTKTLDFIKLEYLTLHYLI